MNELILKREIYLDSLKSWLGTPLVKVITGMRRTGKSTILRQWADYIKTNNLCSASNFLYIECDSLEHTGLTNWEDLKSIILPIEKLPQQKFLIIDEIQNIDGWEKVIAALQKKTDWDIYITGSNSSMLSGELATRISGRYIQMEVYPFSYKEHLEITTQMKHSPQQFQRYLESGGLPTLYHVSDEPRMKQQTLEAIFSTIILKDIVERFSIRNIALLEKIVHFFFDNIGNLSTAKNISDFCKSQKLSVGVETVQNYISYLESCYLLRRAKRNDLKGKKILEFNEKLYVNDHGLRNAVLRRRTQDIGALLENLIYIELLRRGYSITVGRYKTLEIDFVAEKDDAREYYQISYLLSSEETIEREFRSLGSLSDNYPKFVLSMDQINLSRNGIEHRYIPDWLVGGEYKFSNLA